MAVIDIGSRVAATAPDTPPLPVLRKCIESNDLLSLSSTHTSQLAKSLFQSDTSVKLTITLLTIASLATTASSLDDKTFLAGENEARPCR
jgi:hypothetical protein